MKRDTIVDDGSSGSTVMKKLSTMWKSLPAKEKEKYSQMAKENKKKDLEHEAEELAKKGESVIPRMIIPVVSSEPLPVSFVTEINLSDTPQPSTADLPPTTQPGQPLE